LNEQEPQHWLSEEKLKSLGGIVQELLPLHADCQSGIYVVNLQLVQFNHFLKYSARVLSHLEKTWDVHSLEMPDKRSLPDEVVVRLLNFRLAACHAAAETHVS